MLPDAEALCAQLAAAIRADIDPARTALVGIHTGGAWVAEKLHAALGIAAPLGTLDVSFYRDDYGSRGLNARARASQIPFDVDGARILIVDDVLYTGRTIRAAINELFDYGRPGRIELAVLADRGGRELPVEPRWCAYRVALASAQTLELRRDADARLSFRVTEK